MGGGGHSENVLPNPRNKTRTQAAARKAIYRAKPLARFAGDEGTPEQRAITFIEDTTFLESIGGGCHSALVQPVGQQKLANIELRIVCQGSTSRFVLEKRREQTVHRNARSRNSRSHGRRVARCERVKPQRGHAGTIERLELATSGLVHVLSSTSVLSLAMVTTLMHL
jgi:hypothetical protein